MPYRSSFPLLVKGPTIFATCLRTGLDTWFRLLWLAIAILPFSPFTQPDFFFVFFLDLFVHLFASFFCRSRVCFVCFSFVPFLAFLFPVVVCPSPFAICFSCVQYSPPPLFFRCFFPFLYFPTFPFFFVVAVLVCVMCMYIYIFIFPFCNLLVVIFFFSFCFNVFHPVFCLQRQSGGDGFRLRYRSGTTAEGFRNLPPGVSPRPKVIKNASPLCLNIWCWRYPYSSVLCPVFVLKPSLVGFIHALSMCCISRCWYYAYCSIECPIFVLLAAGVILFFHW